MDVALLVSALVLVLALPAITYHLTAKTYSELLDWATRQIKERNQVIQVLLDRVQASSFQDVVQARALDLSSVPPPAPDPVLWSDATGLVTQEVDHE